MPPPLPLPPPARRHRQPFEDLVGLMSFAFFLFAVATVFAQNPNLIANLRGWMDLVSANHTIFVRPTDAVIVSAAWFFGVIGALEFVSASVRRTLRWIPLNVAARVLAGVGDLAFAALLVVYARRAISGAFLLTVLVGIAAVLLMIYIALGTYWSSVRAAVRPGLSSPPARL
jgi:hypothetical protein